MNCCKPDCRAEIVIYARGLKLLLKHYLFTCPKCGSECFTDFSHGTKVDAAPAGAIEVGKNELME
ncbi:MAG: hypothetical protein ACOYOU_15850 [Kiritimatiellia bacterium]